MSHNEGSNDTPAEPAERQDMTETRKPTHEEYTCRCGELDGVEHCAWTGDLSDLVLVEYMPEQHRSSHAAAGNSGCWPHNGAIRAAIQSECAERFREFDLAAPDGCTWFQDLGRPADLAEYAEDA